MKKVLAIAVLAALTTGCNKPAGLTEDTSWKASKPTAFCASYGRYVYLTRENTDGSVYVQCNSKYGDEIALHADVTKTRTYQKL